MTAFVVCDTNVYRNWAFGRSTAEVDSFISSLRARETTCGVTPLANLLVGTELLARLADRTDKAYTNCQLAMRTLYAHCRSDNSRLLHLVADAETQVCRSLFGHEPPANAVAMKAVSMAAAMLYVDPSEETYDEFRGLFGVFRDLVAAREAQFLSDLWKYVVLALDPNATTWHPLRDNSQLRTAALEYLASPESRLAMARMYVLKAHRMAGVSPTDADLQAMVAQVAEWFQLPIALYTEVLRRIVMSGFDMTKKNRENWIWDTDIAFCAGQNHAIGQRPIWLVTGDGAILKAAHALSIDSVMDPYTYLARVEMSDLP